MNERIVMDPPMFVKKNSMLFAVVLLILALSQGRSQAHFGDVLLPIIELSDRDLESVDLDGSIQEWRDLVGEPTLTARDFQPWDAEGLAGHDPANLDMAVWLAWHEGTNRIYAAALIVDDIYYNEFSGITARLQGDATNFHDSFEVMVDGDHSRGMYYASGALEEDEFRRTYNQQAQRYGAVVESANGKKIHLAVSSAWVQWPNEPPYADAGGFVAGETPLSLPSSCL